MSNQLDYLKKQINQVEEKIKENTQLLKDKSLKDLAQQEISQLKQQKQVLQKSLKDIQKSLKNKQKKQAQANFDNKPATIEIRGAAGGDEAKLFADDLQEMYTRFAQSIGFKVQNIDSGIIKVSGNPKDWPLGPYGTFKYESGVHRVQRVPQTETQGRIHTSTATVAVLPEINPKQVELKDSELEWNFSRSGGPGGQNVNKVATAVRLTHVPSGQVVSVRQERTQQRNREIALERLRQLLWKQRQEEQQKKLKTTRSQAVGTGDRAEKIRTYNFPQNRVTDHRINQSWHQLDDILNGELKKVIKTTHKELPQS